MFIVLLKFAANKSHAAQYMEGHNAWVQHGLDDGVFMMVGSLQPNMGGGILAHNTEREALQQRIDEDPFVVHGIVSAELLELTPAITDSRLDFLRQ